MLWMSLNQLVCMPLRVTCCHMCAWLTCTFCCHVRSRGTSSSFARNTRRLSPSTKPRNDPLTSRSLCAATKQYAPPACCSDSNDFLQHMYHAHITYRNSPKNIQILMRNLTVSCKTIPCAARQRGAFRV